MRGVLLGMGSNTGDRIGNLTKALNELIRRGLIYGPIRTSRLYRSDALLLENSPKEWNLDFINGVVEARTALSPDALLHGIHAIEKHMGRGEHEKWSPRSIDIDLLYMDDTVLESEALTIPHLHIFKRAFVLYPLADLLPNEKPMGHKLTFREEADALKDDLHTQAIDAAFLPTQVVGILNITPDSFSDGDRYADPRQALEQVKKLVANGAGIIDLGAESTRPGAESITAQEEWNRLTPVLQMILPWLQDNTPWIKVSVDTRNASVAAKCLEMGTHIINDVTGLDDPEMRELAMKSQAPFIFMHHMGVPVVKGKNLPSHCDPVDEIKKWALNKIQQFQSLNLPLDKAILDPGIGFGKSPTQSIQVLRRFQELNDLGLPIYLGFSRKSMFNLITEKPFSERDLESNTLAAATAQSTPDYLRVHDVDGCVRTLKASLLMHAAPCIQYGNQREVKSGS
mgnify:CR=1 FL=1